METRLPTQDEQHIWDRYQMRFERQTKPMIQSLVMLAQIGNDAQILIESITDQKISIVTDDAATRINTIGRYAQIIEHQITGVLLQKYGIQIDASGRMDITAFSTPPEGDIMPPKPFDGFGIAPQILVLVGVGVATLLVGGWEILTGLETQAKREATALQSKMIAADAEMMTRPAAERKQWSIFKKNTADAVKNATGKLSDGQSFFEKWIGKRGVSIGIAGIIGIAALYFLVPRLRKN